MNTADIAKLVAELKEEVAFSGDTLVLIRKEKLHCAIAAIETLQAENERLTKELKIQDEANDLLTAELAQLRAQPQGWVKLSERKPTREDGDRGGNVLFANAYKANCYTVPEIWSWGCSDSMTHWQRLPSPPPAEPTAAEVQALEDDNVMRLALMAGDTVREAFYRGVAHARAAKEKL